MKNLPNKIYLIISERTDDFKDHSGVLWSDFKENESDIEYTLSDPLISVSGINHRVFTIAIIRDLNYMVKSGQITSSKMVELMNEAVKWQEVDLGNKYLRDMINDLKDDPDAAIT